MNNQFVNRSCTGNRCVSFFGHGRMPFSAMDDLARSLNDRLARLKAEMAPNRRALR